MPVAASCRQGGLASAVLAPEDSNESVEGEVGDPMPRDLDQVYDLITRRLLKGKVVPVLGAGVNLSDRPMNAGYEHGRYLPSGRELARELAKYIRVPIDESYDLARVSQYVSALEGEGSLYEELHDVFDADYPPTRLHGFLAKLSKLTREAGARECMLIVTTNYDDALERAFQSAGEPYDVVSYIAEGRDRGLFLHLPWDGSPVVIRVPNEYAEIPLETRPIIAKIHGAVDRVTRRDSYVITEDHYIDYITRADVGSLFPVTLHAKLKTNHLMFLGYSLRDWNFRVMLYRLWGEQEGLTFKSWAIQDKPDPIDRAAWDERGVDILAVSVQEFVQEVEERLTDDNMVRR
jgi:SIR2-like domain